MMEFRKIDAAQDIPEKWNAISECYFQRTPFLVHLEKYNPCEQRYYLCVENGTLIAAAIVYALPVNVFSFAGIKNTLQMQIVGVPCSVSCSGIFGRKEGVKKLTEHIFRTEKGFVLLLNQKDNPSSEKYARGKTLPTIVFKNRFSDWNDYLASLSSPYRRRIKKLTTDPRELLFRSFSCSDFSTQMYRLYENVYEKSDAKLEKLTFDFFKHLPSEFCLTACFRHEKVIGWNIGLNDSGIYYFFLGGVDYEYNKTQHTYLRLLARLVKKGIDCKAGLIELGQTAEISKTRMGESQKPSLCKLIIII